MADQFNNLDQFDNLDQFNNLDQIVWNIKYLHHYVAKIGGLLKIRVSSECHFLKNLPKLG